MPQGLDNFIGAVGDAIKTAPTFYEDALQPTVQETGKILALIPQTIEAALLPLRKWNIEREYKFAETKKLLEQKLENIDPEKIVTPESYVAVPAIQAISYSMDSAELRNLYANLLAKAMNSDTKNQVHPAFVEIIKQMSPIDAKVLDILANHIDYYFPLIDIIACNKDIKTKPTTYLFQNLSSINISISNVALLSLSFENLKRNNLLDIIDKRFTKGYDSVYNSQEYLNIIESLKTKLTSELPHLDTKEKTGYLTQFGKAFCQICILN